MQEYVARVAEALTRHSSAGSAMLLSLRDAHVGAVAARLPEGDVSAYLAGMRRVLAQHRIGGGDAEAVEAHFEAVAALRDGRLVDAYEAQLRVFKSLCEEFKEESGDNWRLKLIECSVIDLRLLAGKADNELLGAEREVHCLLDTMNVLVDHFK